MLVIAFSRKNFERNNKANHWADFDTGSAWMSLCFQAEKLGYRCHAMAGFDPKKALEVVGLSAENIRPIAVIAIGKQGNKNILPEDMQKKEIQSDRKPIEQIVFEGKIS
jgi:nitroreductase